MVRLFVFLVASIIVAVLHLATVGLYTPTVVNIEYTLYFATYLIGLSCAVVAASVVMRLAGYRLQRD